MFHRVLPFVLALAVILPANAADKKEKGKKGDAAGADAGEDEVRHMMATHATLSGRVASAGEGAVTLQFDIPRLDAGGGKGGDGGRSAGQQQQQLLRQQADILRARSPWERAQRMQRLAAQARQQGAGGGVRVVMDHKDFEFPTAAGVPVRRVSPPFTLDENGKQKKYTSKELAELKGDGKLPGYKAEMSDVQPGAMVKLTFGRPKAEKDGKAEGGRVVTLVMIETDPEAGATAEEPRKKK